MNALVRLTLIWVLMLFLAGYVRPQAMFVEESKSRADAREAIFRYMFERYKYGPSVKVLCIAAERPLPESFLQRFATDKIPVIWASDCATTDPIHGVQRKITGQRGMLMTIREMKWYRADEAVAEVEAYSDGMAANSNRLRIELQGGHWVVASDKVKAVS